MEQDYPRFSDAEYARRRERLAEAMAKTRVVRYGTTMQEIIAAAGVIDDKGLTVCDDLMHGFGGGFFRPSSAPGAAPPAGFPRVTNLKLFRSVQQPPVFVRFV